MVGLVAVERRCVSAGMSNKLPPWAEKNHFHYLTARMGACILPQHRQDWATSQSRRSRAASRPAHERGGLPSWDAWLQVRRDGGAAFIHPAAASMDVFLARLLRSEAGFSYELGRPRSDGSASRTSSRQGCAAAWPRVRLLRWKPGAKGRALLELRRVLGQRARRPASGWRVDTRGGRVHLPHAADASA